MLHGSWGRQTLNDMAYLTTSRLPDGYLTFRSWRIPEPMLAGVGSPRIFYQPRVMSRADVCSSYAMRR